MLIEVRAVSKRLGGRTVLDAVSVARDRAGVVVVHGANGAGKSTLLRIVCGLVAPDAGDVVIAGASLARDRVAALRALGYLPELTELPEHLTVAELLALVAALKRCAPLGRAVVERVGAAAVLDQRVGTLSLGQRRRACLAAALVGEPAVLVLDEPTNGLDVDGVAMLADLLRERTAGGGVTVLATHDQAFVAHVADARVELANGRVVAP